MNTTYGAAIWLGQLPGSLLRDQTKTGSQRGKPLHPKMKKTPMRLSILTVMDCPEHDDDDSSDEEQGNPDMPRKGWIGLKLTRQ